MKKKKRSKKEADVAAKTPEVRPDVEKISSFPDESRAEFDYGGLPDRDLKKNLGGCG